MKFIPWWNFALKALLFSFLLLALGKTDSSKEDDGDEDRDAHDHVDIRSRRLKSFVLGQPIVIVVVIDAAIARWCRRGCGRRCGRGR